LLEKLFFLSQQRDRESDNNRWKAKKI